MKVCLVVLGTALSLNASLSFAKEAPSCSSLFFEIEKSAPSRQPHIENGHNVPLRNIMLQMKEYEFAIREFVDGLTPKPQSEFLKDNSSKFRNKDTLATVLKIVTKYERILSHLVEHSEHVLMSPRIQSIPVEKRAEFISRYKQAYIDYLSLYKKLVVELNAFEHQDPSKWNNHEAQNILMEMHSFMGAAHNKF